MANPEFEQELTNFSHDLALLLAARLNGEHHDFITFLDTVRKAVLIASSPSPEARELVQQAQNLLLTGCKEQGGDQTAH